MAGYLLCLWEVKKLSVSSVKAHCSMLSAVFRFKLPELSEHHVLRNLIRSFAIERPRRSSIAICLGFGRRLVSAAYEPLESLRLQALTEETLFLVALATTKRVGELQALSRIMSSVVVDLVVSYLPFFTSKTEQG